MPKIRWAAKVSRDKILRLYQNDAQGLVDEALIDEVGFDLYLRCQSILMVTEAKRVPCPRCDDEIVCQAERWSRHTAIACPRCGWSCTYGQYRDSWRHQDLHGGNAVYAFKAFVDQYERATAPRERMLLIDRLIQAFHWSIRHNRRHGPAAPNLIAGSREQVLAFLDQLALG